MYRLAYWLFLILVATGLSYIYFHRQEIPLTYSFERALDTQIVIINERKIELAKNIFQFEAEQDAERALRERAKSSYYSSPTRALRKEWYRWQIYFWGILQALFTYRFIFYLLTFTLLLLLARSVFWRLLSR